MVYNLNGAMKYIFGEKKQVKIKNQTFYKSMMPVFSNEAFKKELAQLAILYLKNSGASSQSLEMLQQALDIYVDEKGKRNELPQQEKISYKRVKGEEMHQEWLRKNDKVKRFKSRVASCNERE